MTGRELAPWFICALAICALLISFDRVFAGMDARACAQGVAEACRGAR